MGFEFFRSRKDLIEQPVFQELLKDQQVRMEVNAVMKELEFIMDEGAETPSHFEYGDGYANAIKVLQNTLDTRNVLATDEAILEAILTSEDPDGSKGWAELV
jgi:replication fork clamp-binding protein CrfC